MKKIYIFRLLFSYIIFFLYVLAFTYGTLLFTKLFHIQLYPSISRLFLSFSIATFIIIFLILLLTFIFGRFYCSIICPFGILQELIDYFSKHKNNYVPNLSKLRYVISIIVFGLFFGGYIIGFKHCDPYSIFGLTISNIYLTLTSNLGTKSILLTIFFVVVLFLLVIWKRRIFCTAICPIGTLLGLLSKYSIYKINISDKCISCGLCNRSCPTNAIDYKNKNVNNEICVKCLKCFNTCKKEALIFSKSNNGMKFSISRRNFITNTTLILCGISLATATGILNVKDIKAKQKIKRVICPPGANSTTDLYLNCTNCQLCVINCPTKIIKPKGTKYQTININYSKGYCDYNCNKCSSICPTNALKKLSLSQKQNIRIGIAKIDKDLCNNCGICTIKCPKKALTLDKDKQLQFNANLCIGCGYCHYYCPHKAIDVVAIVKQTSIN